MIENRNTLFTLSFNILGIILTFVLQIGFLSTLWAILINIFALLVLSVFTIKRMAKTVGKSEETTKEIYQDIRLFVLISFVFIFLPIAGILFFFNSFFWSIEPISSIGIAKANIFHVLVLFALFMLQSFLMQISYWQKFQTRVQPNFNPKKETGRILEFPLHQLFRVYGGVVLTALIIFLFSPFFFIQPQQSFTTIYFIYAFVYDSSNYWRKQKSVW